jgi:CheY-like chemotaxis protein
VKSERILIVEDEGLVALSLKVCLECAGYEVEAVVSSGEEAIALAATGRSDLIIMDISLKGSLDGIAAAERIRSLRDVPVIYLTAHSDAGTLDRIGSTSSAGIILKPIDENDLVSAVDAVFGRLDRSAPF